MIPFSGFPGPSMTAMTGKPVGKKTRRGGKKKPATSLTTHHQNIGTALAAKDHGAARSHAFALIRALPAPAGAPTVPDEPEPAPVAAPTPVTPAAPSGPTGASKLAGLLRMRGK